MAAHFSSSAGSRTAARTDFRSSVCRARTRQAKLLDVVPPPLLCRTRGLMWVSGRLLLMAAERNALSRACAAVGG